VDTRTGWGPLGFVQAPEDQALIAKRPPRSNTARSTSQRDPLAAGESLGAGVK
jgi:hypothetical protein